MIRESELLVANELRWASELAQFNFDIGYRSGKATKKMQIVFAKRTKRVHQKRF